MPGKDDGLFAQLRAAMPAGDHACLRTTDGRDFNYGDVLAHSARLAHCLVRIGIKPGDRIASQVDKSPEALFLYFASLRAGAVFLPLNPAYTPTETEYFLRDAAPACLAVAPEKETSIATFAQQSAVTVMTLGADGRAGTLVARARDMPDDFDDVPRAGDDLAAILYTSGTTGRSKGALLTQQNLASNARALRDLWRFTGTDVLLHALPLYHTHGLFTATNTILLAGAAMILLPKFESTEVLAHLPASTTMMGVPTFYTRLLGNAGLTREAVSHMRLFISGSAPLSAETHRAWLARTGHAILERYGMTETSMIASNPYDGERVPGAVGFPLPGVELRIAEPKSGAALEPGEVGMIELRGPNVCKGYWRNAEQTAAAFRADGFFITGDLGSIDAKGVLRIAGRAKDLVISGGLNIYPKEIEAEIDVIEGVVESAVIGVAHPDLGEAVTAFVVRKEGAVIDEAEILAALGPRLARYKLPRRVLFVDDLPRNAMGKVEKSALRQMFPNIYR
jgi:malonyl-CoA/methylmalonyl-CoA synthetase